MCSESESPKQRTDPMSSTPLVLASASPRRHKILTAMGLVFEFVVSAVEEVHWLDDPKGTVRENAARKCMWASERQPDVTVIAADTVVVLDGKAIGKPKSRQEAAAMLRSSSGRTQTVYTGLAMGCRRQLLEQSVTKSLVHFRDLTDAAIEQYFQRVDPLDKAGGYDIDQHSDSIIRGYEGSWTNIMGLPQGVLEQWLASN